ncbi:MAG TPA: hypothetical protein VGK00_04345 [Anaerolineales bacterium]|jgi:hypothetical protein
MKVQKPVSPEGSPSINRFLIGVVLVLGVVCLGLWGLALYRSGFMGAKTPTPEIAQSNKKSCQDLIEQAIRISNDHCDRIGPNQVCYGNITIKADLLPSAQQKFTSAGDMVDIQNVQKLYTTPLDLQKKEWGIAVLNIIANLPRSLPGEAVKMVVFGNTTLGTNEGTDIQSFYFSSELGQIVCDKVPFDGIMISMPDGTGVKLIINGSELMLRGNASLSAVQNSNMNITLFSGTASITADGQTMYFGAGQMVQVPLGGATGTDPVGPPSDPVAIGPDEATLGCTLNPLLCQASAIPTLDPAAIIATLNAGLTGTPEATVPAIGTVAPTAPNSGATQSGPGPTTDPNAPKKTPPGLAKKTPRP